MPVQGASMSRRMWILAAAAGVIVVGGLSVLVLVWLTAQRASERALAAIHVGGYEQIDYLADSLGDNTTSTGIYIGPPAASSELDRIVTGPGVRVTVLPGPSDAVAYPGTVVIARGAAPQGCKLEVEEFLQNAPPYSWLR